jgi:two-component system catabolic regulation response regulator CreB
VTPHILIVEDEPAIAESVAYALSRDGFSTGVASSCEKARALMHEASLIVLDLMLPDGSGLDLIPLARGATKPIIVLSSRDGEEDRVLALETGADDYVVKPFSPREVVARVRAVLRRAGPASHSALRVDRARRRAYVYEAELDLTRVEFELLATLLEDSGRVYTREGLIDAVWGPGFAMSDRTVDSHVKSLRKKLGDSHTGQLIETVRGVGYRIADAADAARGKPP